MAQQQLQHQPPQQAAAPPARAPRLYWSDVVRERPTSATANAVGALQSHAQLQRSKGRYGGQMPRYTCIRPRRPATKESAATFCASVTLGEHTASSAGYSKAEAKQRAAAAWLTAHRIFYPHYKRRGD